jgi:pimeloyl-[acyl-carrier protein] methyl ester esterase
MHPLSGRTLVFLPGLDGTGLSFEPVEKLLPHDVDVRVVRYPNDKRLDFEQTVHWARSQIPGDREVVVLAESFSGPVAAALAGSGQINAGYVIFCATFARSPRPGWINASKHLPMTALLRLPFPSAILCPFVEGGRESVDILMDLWRRVRKIVPPDTLIHRLHLINTIDVRGWLPHLSMPCLYIQATGDRTVPPSCLLNFVITVPHLSVRRIKGPHFILQAQPRLCLAAIEDLLGRNAGKS